MAGEDRNIVIGWTKALGGAVALGVLVLGGVAWLDSKNREAISDLAQWTHKFDDRQNGVAAELSKSSLDLNTRISDLVATLQVTNANLASSNGQWDRLSEQVASVASDLKQLQIEMASDNRRQASFERWAVGQFGATAPLSSDLPAEWQAATEQVARELTTELPPLLNWAQAAGVMQKN